jgi:uncharacterized protein YbbC (DUF1343 family)/CubicO group peptidase (beta-lactamase class C family)
MTPRASPVCFLPVVLVMFALLARPAVAAEKALPACRPEALGLSSEALARIDTVVQQALERQELPGAVVVIVHRGQVVFRKAYGRRTVRPMNVVMTLDTVFDLASLTKPIATATAIMLLIEKGQLRLSDRVQERLPGFRPRRKDATTVEHLLLHTSGLIADNPVSDYRDGRARALERIFALEPVHEPGQRFVYSDLNYILLAEIVERSSGMPLDAFTGRHIFSPLGMNETTFRPTGKLKERAAPTEQRDGRWLAGDVHDPRAALLGGVAGHAGLFSTADDLAVFAQMLLDGGAYNGRRILSPATVRLMTTPHPVPERGRQGLRTYGFDVDTAFSKNRGSLFAPDKGFGHTGFTGTSLWIDPPTQTAVIFLSSRLHPTGKGNVTRLRGQVATIAAAAVSVKDGRKTPAPAKDQDRKLTNPTRNFGPVATGIDVLVRENFRRLQGRRVGLVTNHTGRDRDGHSTIDLLHQAKGVTLVALFSPEHGLRGGVDEKVADGKDAKTGLPVYSLYGMRRRPTAETLKGIDTLVYDIQDAGCRFYTYSSTLGLVLESAAEHKLKVVVLDRPNPIGGREIEGPVRDPGRDSFVAYHTLPLRHGLTVGEMARLFNKERHIDADLEVVPMEGWRRGDLYDRTGLLWINPSPNLRSLNAALTYPGIGLLETTNVSVGRGTERPFEWVGAPWIDGRRLAAALVSHDLPGVRFVPVNLTPTASVHKGKLCGGVHIIIDDWARYRPVRTGIAFACTLRKLYPKGWKLDRFDVLLGHRASFEALQRGASWQELELSWQSDVERFRQKRLPYLLYPD